MSAAKHVFKVYIQSWNKKTFLQEFHGLNLFFKKTKHDRHVQPVVLILYLMGREALRGVASSTRDQIPDFSSPRVLILDCSFWSQEQEEPLSSSTCLQYLHEVSNCLWIALTNLFRIGRGFEYCHFSFMTSKGPVVKIGKEHSQRDVGNQRCFLSNSLSDSGTTTPAAHGKISSQQHRERENRARERDNKESWIEKIAWNTGWREQESEGERWQNRLCKDLKGEREEISI